MPHVIGGKQVYGLSRVGMKGKIIIPKEALDDYGLKPNMVAILISGTRLSGGFELTTPKIIDKSPPMKKIFADNPRLSKLQIKEGTTIESGGKSYCWVKVNRDNSITIPPSTLSKFQLKPGDLIPSVGGNYLQLHFPSKGPTVQKSRTSSQLGIYEDRSEKARMAAAKKRKVAPRSKAADIKTRKSESKTKKTAPKEEEKEETARFGVMSLRYKRKRTK
jgi:bifunctional DNA-binding transcriptional regulator/antitoxin component of YhaV-PrlF toxin-antitoxin module